MAYKRYYTYKQVSLRQSARQRNYILYSRSGENRMTICYDDETNRSAKLEDTMTQHGFKVRRYIEPKSVMAIYDYMIPGER